MSGGGIRAELRGSVVRLVDGATKADRRLRRSILISVAILGAWMFL